MCTTKYKNLIQVETALCRFRQAEIPRHIPRGRRSDSHLASGRRSWYTLFDKSGIKRTRLVRSPSSSSQPPTLPSPFCRSIDDLFSLDPSFPRRSFTSSVAAAAAAWAAAAGPVVRRSPSSILGTHPMQASIIHTCLIADFKAASLF